ncbi:MAG: cytochrome c oxidase subunit 3 [Planctomycetota bacterium]
MNDLSPTAPPPAPSPAPFSSPPGHRVPRGAGRLGMWLFLAGLAMLFLSSMLAYVLVRWSKTRTVYFPGTDNVYQAPTAPPLGSIHPPMGLFISTLVILASSFTIHLALKNVRLERQKRFRGALIATLVLSVLFLLVQTPSLWSLFAGHDAANLDNTMLGMIFALIVIHALHVIGGIIPLGVVTYRAGQDRYDHEHYEPVRHVALYWHFLDVVWLFMFGVFWLVR